MGKSGLLGAFEEIVLLAVLHIGADAYAVPVRRLLVERLGRPLSMGAVYRTLERLEEKGLATSHPGEGDAIRRGRPRRVYRILPTGVEALRRSARLRANVWRGVDLPAEPRPSHGRR